MKMLLLHPVLAVGPGLRGEVWFCTKAQSDGGQGDVQRFSIMKSWNHVSGLAGDAVL